MNINDENIQEMREQFVPLFKMFRKKLAEEDIPQIEKNAILYNVITELVDTAFLNNFDDAELSAEDQAALKETMLNTIIDIWKEQDPELEISEELIAYSEQISSFGESES